MLFTVLNMDLRAESIGKTIFNQESEPMEFQKLGADNT